MPRGYIVSRTLLLCATITVFADLGIADTCLPRCIIGLGMKKATQFLIISRPITEGENMKK